MTVEELTKTLRRLARTATTAAENWMYDKQPGPQVIERDLRHMIGIYADSAALHAADWYLQLAPKVRFRVTRDFDLPDEKITDVAKWIWAGPQTPESRIKMVAGRLVFDAARRTLYVNADREGVALARHEEAQCCNDCVARATTEVLPRNALASVPDAFFHPGCEGLYVPVRKGAYEPPDHAREWAPRVQAARHAGNHNADTIAKFLDAH